MVIHWSFHSVTAGWAVSLATSPSPWILGTGCLKKHRVLCVCPVSGHTIILFFFLTFGNLSSFSLGQISSFIQGLKCLLSQTVRCSYWFAPSQGCSHFYSANQHFLCLSGLGPMQKFPSLPFLPSKRWSCQWHVSTATLSADGLSGDVKINTILHRFCSRLYICARCVISVRKGSSILSFFLEWLIYQPSPLSHPL